MAFRPQRQHRYWVYRDAGYLPYEAMELSSIRFVEIPYIRHALRDRQIIKRNFDKEADFNNWSKSRRVEEYLNIIRRLYLDNNWLRPSASIRIGRPTYKASPWELLAHYRRQAIDRGEYHPPQGKHVKRQGDKLYIHIYKGDVQSQKARARAKLQAKHGTPEYERHMQKRREQAKRARLLKRAREH